MDFTKYQHLERLGTTAVEGIQSGTVHVFPKLDGTNASIWMDDERQVKAGSRNRELTLDKDNAGFYRWVLAQEKLRDLLEGWSDCIFYGEWLVPHSLKTYREDAWRRFYIFDVYQDGVPMSFDRYQPILDAYEVDYLPPIAVVNNGDDETFRRCAAECSYLIQEDQGVGEGVVLKNYDWVNRFGDIVWAKVVNNSFKDEHVKTMGAHVLGGLSDEERIVEAFVTPHLVDKVVAKITLKEDGWTGNCVPQLLSTVFYDLITEEMWEILKKFKNPKIDFKYLNRLTTQRIKEFRGDLF